jgi:hypothetical protein
MDPNMLQTFMKQMSEMKEQMERLQQENARLNSIVSELRKPTPKENAKPAIKTEEVKHAESALSEAKPLSKKQKQKEKRKAKKQRQREAKKDTPLPSVERFSRVKQPAEKSAPKSKLAQRNPKNQTNKQKKKERKQKLKEKYLKKKERKQAKKQLKLVEEKEPIVEEKEPIIEDDGNPGFTQSYRTNKYGAIIYYLKKPEMLSEDGNEIDFILESIQAAFNDIPKTYPDFKAYVANCTIKAELKSDNRVVNDPYVSLKFGDLLYPNFDRNKATRFIRNSIEKYAVSDKWLNPISVTLYVIESPKGGCYHNHDYDHNTGFKSLKTEGLTLHNPYTKNNNCFFYCLKPEFKNKGIKLTIGVCDELRKQYGLKKGEPVDIETAVRFTKEYFGLDLGIMNSNKEYFTEQKGDVTLLLANEHYMRVFGIERICEYCNSPVSIRHDSVSCANRVTSRANHFDKSKRFPLVKRLRPKIWDKAALGTKLRPENYYILSYDIEAYKKDENGVQIPNCLGYCYYTDEKYPNKKYEVITGENCLEEFVYRLWHDKDLLHVRAVNAYNGAGYDHLLLINKEKHLADLGQINPLIVNSGVLSGSVGLRYNGKDKEGKDKYGKKKLVDLSRHLSGTLKDNLKEFKCNVQKGDFDHTKNGPWNTLSEDVKQDLLKYLQSDVLGLVELSDKVHNALIEKYGTSWVHFVSKSDASYKIALDSMREKYIVTEKLMLPSLEHYTKYIRPSIYGARCQVQRKYFKSKDLPAFNITKQHDSFSWKTDLKEEQIENIQDYVMDLDVNSLYPYAMTMDFPAGIPYSVNEYHPDKLGIYNVKFTSNKTLITSPLPRRGPNTELLWDVEDGEGTYTNVDIEIAKKRGYSFEILDGIVWPEKIPMFKEHIEKLYKDKNSSVKGTVAYELAKIYMNALYGKTLQKPRFQKTFYVNKKTDWEEILPNYHIDTIDSETFQDCWIVKCTAKNQVLLEKAITKPAQIGTFILAYSRQVMMDYIDKLNPNNEKGKQIYYTDTDSLQCHINEAKNIDLTEQGLGKMANDLGKGAKIIEGIWVSPKMYLLKYLIKDSGCIMLKEHRVGKGIKKVEGYTLKDGEIKKKGIIPLVEEDYKSMSDGNTKEIKNKDVFKRFTINLNNKEKERGTELFSVSLRDVDKVLNKKPWAGRIFDSTLCSVPYGYSEE